jgi:hypothetical protein
MGRVGGVEEGVMAPMSAPGSGTWATPDVLRGGFHPPSGYLKNAEICEFGAANLPGATRSAV